MFRLDAGLKVFVHRDAVDGRKNINGLALLVEQALEAIVILADIHRLVLASFLAH